MHHSLDVYIKRVSEKAKKKPKEISHLVNPHFVFFQKPKFKPSTKLLCHINCVTPKNTLDSMLKINRKTAKMGTFMRNRARIKKED